MQEDLLETMNGKKGHFKLESGYHGDLWLDLDTLFLKPAKLHSAVDLLSQLLSKYSLDGICGPLTGGAFLAEMIASKLDLDFYYAQRFTHPEKKTLFSVEYKLPENLSKQIVGKKLAIIDDVINAGSATKATYTSLQKAGADVVVVGSLLVLGEKINDFIKSEQLALETLEKMSSNTWLPENCPLCKASIPLKDFVS